MIVARDYHNIAVKADGTVWTWGWTINGQLGNGTTVDSEVPVQVIFPAVTPCTYAMSPLDLSNIIAAGGSPTITVTTPADCPVPATSFQPWVTVNTITPIGGTTSVSLQVSANAGVPRATSILVADRLFLVTQLGQ